MKKFLSILISPLFLLFFTVNISKAEGELNLYNWGDYINPAVLEKFTAETGIKINLDVYGSNEEMLAKIQAGATGYDIVFPSVHYHDILFKLGLLHETKINESPLFKNIDKDFIIAKTDPDGSWCLPYARGTVGIFYNKDIVPSINSWNDFFAIPEKHNGKITMLDDPRETIGVGLIVNGNSVNSTDPAEVKAAAEYISQNRDNISAFSYDIISLLQNGDIAAAHWYVGGLYYVFNDPDQKLAYAVPEEGATMYQEDMCVLASAPNKDNARKFMEFYLNPENPAINTEQQLNISANAPSREMLPDNLKSNPFINPPSEDYAKLQIFDDLGQDIRIYDREWTKIKAQ
jgi:spermidine/putrescine transport system substrate-binding protein